jgi:energy-coupling factor transporter ATP-binding protein EcfA2
VEVTRTRAVGVQRAALRNTFRRAAGATADSAARTVGATLLLLDEPTDNLDLVSAEALEDGLAGFEGTVVAVTHDRWFARGFDRYLVFGADGRVREAAELAWEESRGGACRLMPAQLLTPPSEAARSGRWPR